MWLLTPIGFFSIVAHRDDPGALRVGSRLAADIDSPNFKAAVAARQGCERARVYGKIWSGAAAERCLRRTPTPRFSATASRRR